MADLIRTLLVPATIFAGWLLSRSQRELATAVSSGLALICTAILLAIVSSGIFHKHFAAADVHRWSGHGFFIAIWMSSLFILGVTIQEAATRRAAATVGRFAILVLLILATISASVTGYMLPENPGDADREVVNRFLAVHCVFLPTFLAMLLGLCCWQFWPARPASPRSIEES